MNDISQADYWQKRYEQGQTGWDMGTVSPPLKAYIDQLSDKTLRILVPGAGNAYEVAYLYEQGFEQVYLLDFAQAPLDNFAQRHPNFPKTQLLREDFFALDASEQQFDLIIEQTFFCAIPVDRRDDYVRQMQRLLTEQGKLVGVLFDTHFEQAGPPFGGDAIEYRQRFEPHFESLLIERCDNSHPARQGKELFVSMRPLPSSA